MSMSYWTITQITSIHMLCNSILFHVDLSLQERWNTQLNDISMVFSVYYPFLDVISNQPRNLFRSLYWFIVWWWLSLEHSCILNLWLFLSFHERYDTVLFCQDPPHLLALYKNTYAVLLQVRWCWSCHPHCVWTPQCTSKFIIEAATLACSSSSQTNCLMDQDKTSEFECLRYQYIFNMFPLGQTYQQNMSPQLNIESSESRSCVTFFWMCLLL
jgi:hypothetical protein